MVLGLLPLLSVGGESEAVPGEVVRQDVRPPRKEVVSVTLLQERMRTEITRVPVRRHVIEWVMGVVGIVAAAVGTYMYYAPTNWFLADLAEHWYFGMFTGAGILLTAAFGVFARKAYLDGRGWTTQATVSTVVALAALAGALTFAVIWIV